MQHFGVDSFADRPLHFNYLRDNLTLITSAKFIYRFYIYWMNIVEEHDFYIGKCHLTVCMVFIPNVVMAKLLALVSITHDNNNCFGSLYQYFSFGNEMVGRF